MRVRAVSRCSEYANLLQFNRSSCPVIFGCLDEFKNPSRDEDGKAFK